MTLTGFTNKIVEKKNQTNVLSLLILGFFGGAFIALGGLLSVQVAGGLPALQAENPGIVKFIFGALFPLGLILVALAGAELFTGNTSYYPPVIMGKKATFKDQMKNWTLVYLSNFIGALFVAYFLTYLAELLGEPQMNFAKTIAEKKVHLSFEVAFLRAIGCNWLVCLALWMAFRTESFAGKVLVIWFPIMGFVAMGMEHSIANQFFIPLGIFLGAPISWGDFLVHNLIPVTLGNIVGGAFFVGTLYYWIDKKNHDGKHKI